MNDIRASSLEDDLDRLRQALHLTLGVADMEAGWTDQAREFWAGYFDQLDLAADRKVATAQGQAAGNVFDYGWVNGQCVASPCAVARPRERLQRPLWKQIADFQARLIVHARSLGLS